MTGQNKKFKSIGIVIVCVCLELAVISCKLPFSIQTTDTYLATSVQSTVKAVMYETQEKTIEPNTLEISDPGKTPTPRFVGSAYKFVIHNVKNGENISQYAQQYDTSEGAIMRVNYSLNLPLWEGSTVVIPVGFTNVTQMPYFQPYMVTVEGLTVEDLSKDLEISQDALIYYNNLFDEKPLKVGDWLIIPRNAPGY
jgi:LysM repeat protein